MSLLWWPCPPGQWNLQPRNPSGLRRQPGRTAPLLKRSRIQRRRSTRQSNRLSQAGIRKIPLARNPPTPHATLEALSKLHEVMQRETVSPEQSEPTEVEHDSAVAVLVEEREEAPEAAPGGSNHLLEIPIKLLPMPKRVPVGVSPLSTATPPLIPRLKGLPVAA